MAGRKPGSPKTGGRVKGVPNKNSLGVREILESRNINLIEQMVDDLLQIDEPEKRMNAYGLLLPYVYSKLSAVAISGDITVNKYKGKPLQELLVIAQEKLKK